MSMHGISLRTNFYYCLCFNSRGKVLLFSVKHEGSTQAACRLVSNVFVLASVLMLFFRIIQDRKCISTIVA